MTALGRAAVSAALLGAAAARAADDPAAIFFALLPADVPAGLAADAPLRVRVELTPPGAGKIASLRAWFPGASVAAGAVTLDLAGNAPPAIVAPPVPAQRGPSFFVDHDQPAAAPFRAAVAALGPAPSREALERLVDGWIVHKTMARGLDAASRVAARREGDCSEHAVLLAAAARLAGRPSRFVLGIALVPIGGALRAFGHAWVELHDGRGWSIADATPLPAGVRYVPLSVLEDEGPGYVAALWGGLAPADVKRVVVGPLPHG